MTETEARRLCGDHSLIGRGLIEYDGHCGGFVADGKIEKIVVRPNGDSWWFAFVMAGVECGGDIDRLHWEPESQTLYSQFATKWDVV